MFVSLLVITSILHAATDIDAAVAKVNQAIQERLDYYNKTFPDIQFVHLKANAEWYQSIQALELLLGYQSTSLDFEHPPDLREDLLFATVSKIQMMLIEKMTTSYLFRVGQMPLAKREHVCVITTDPETTLINNRVATAYFIDLPVDELPASRLVDKDLHLNFIIDHEAYHCLDTYYYDGIPMSDKDFSTRHEVYKRETQADMFALAMHIKRHKGITDYAKKIIRLRGMSLLNGEMQHYSAEYMNKILAYDRHAIMQTTAAELLKLTKQIYTASALSYQQYLQYRTNAGAAIHKLGRHVNEMDKPVLPGNLQPQQDKVQQLIQQTKHYYWAFIGAPYPAFK